jgi:hypothetical protein
VQGFNKLISRLNLEHEGLEKANEFYNAGNVKAAMKEIINHFIK